MVRTWLREGVHQFQFPYVGYDNNIGTASIDLIIGSKTSVNWNSGFLFTVLVTQPGYDGPQLEHFIENICTGIKTWLEQHLSEKIDPETIRWFQLLPPEEQSLVVKRVTMKWEAKGGFYHSAEWEEMSPVDNSIEVYCLGKEADASAVNSADRNLAIQSMLNTIKKMDSEETKRPLFVDLWDKPGDRTGFLVRPKGQGRSFLELLLNQKAN